MSGRLFVPQSTLDGWLEQGAADIAPEGLRLTSEGLSLGLEPACRFTRILEGEDAASLLDRVKTEAQLKAIGAEAYGDSVILGDVAYEVVPGFVLVVAGPVEGAAAEAPASGPVPVPAARKEEADLLSQFLLEKLN